jgi:hypothetical protein
VLKPDRRGEAGKRQPGLLVIDHGA